ncbi:hypothetical protein [Zymobacter palmae]|uniref:hypothetical protein n=1 Tax=Zymobacter palmae TaxID=33074 RepID=UPI0011AE87C7|nr:hypothetical protein [Zymobacter palmae]
MLTSALACILFSNCGCPNDAVTINIVSPTNSRQGSLIRIYGEQFDDIKYVSIPGKSSNFKICEIKSNEDPGKINVVIENKSRSEGQFTVSEKFSEIKIILDKDGRFDKAYIR